MKLNEVKMGSRSWIWQQNGFTIEKNINYKKRVENLFFLRFEWDMHKVNPFLVQQAWHLYIIYLNTPLKEIQCFFNAWLNIGEPGISRRQLLREIWHPWESTLTSHMSNSIYFCFCLQNVTTKKVRSFFSDTMVCPICDWTSQTLVKHISISAYQLTTSVEPYQIMFK